MTNKSRRTLVRQRSESAYGSIPARPLSRLASSTPRYGIDWDGRYAAENRIVLLREYRVRSAVGVGLSVFCT
jgi:hypothetical protein